MQQSENVREILSFLKPWKVLGHRKIRVGGYGDGGYVMLDHFPENAIAYSLGIGVEVSWDLDVAALDTDVFQFDHTVDGPPVSHRKFHFRKVGIAAEPSSEGPFDTLDNIIYANGHSKSSLILKMDIEGSEWDVLPALELQKLNLFSQMVIEFHGLARLADPHWQLVIKRTLQRIHKTHLPFHIHGNNWASYAIVGGVPVPDVIEVSFANRNLYNFEANQEIFPTPLDRPCKSDLDDYYLGKFDFGML